MVKVDLSGWENLRPLPSYKPIDFSSIMVNPNSFVNTHDKSKDKKASTGINIFDMLSGILNQVGGAVTDNAYHQIADYKNLFHGKDVGKSLLDLAQSLNPSTTIARGVQNGAKEQVKDWKNGLFNQWGDIPGVGFLHGADTGWKRGEDILKDQVGMKDGWGRTAAGIGIDLLADPLTYFTGGLSAAGKASKAAELAKLAEIAAKEGVAGKFKNFNELGEALVKAHKGTKTSLTNKIYKYQDELTNAVTKAHNEAINTLGMSIPFTNKYASMGKLSEGNLLYRGSAKMGSPAVNALHELFSSKGITKEQGEGLLKRLLGDVNPSELTQAKFDQLATHLDSFKPSANGVKNYGKLEKLASSKLPELMNSETTNLVKKLDKVNPFNLRTFKSPSSFVNGLANHLADATNAKIGGMAKYRKPLQELEKMGKDFTPDEMKAVIHTLENDFPHGFSWSGIRKSAVEAYAKKAKPLLSELKTSEQSSGLLDNTIEHYFPHVKNVSDKEIQKMMNYVSKFNGKSMKNAFNQERTGFRTIAEKDNFIKQASDELANNPNLSDEERSGLEKAIETADKMFNENTHEVLLKRVGASVQAQAMKGMYDKFKKYGALVTKTKGDTRPTKGLVKVAPDVAKKLGLGEGKHYMHPDVLKGLEKVDELFTSGGMNRFMRLLNGTSSLFRTMTTVYLPSHYINNWLGNLAINMAAGVGIKDYTRATKLLTKYNKGTKLTEAEQKIIDAAFKHNVINGGYRIDTDISRSVTKAGDEGKLTTKIADKLEGLNDKLSNNKLGKAAKEKGELIDDYARLANFMNGLDKHNGSVKLASDQVRKYLFNYAENTNADKHMRAIVPFWNWVKRNVPLQLNQLIENPKYYKSTEAFKALFNEAFNPDDKGQDWQKQSGIKIPFEDKYMRLPFPTSDLDMLAHPSQALASTTPLIKAPIELLTNHNLFTGNPLQFGSNKVDDPKVVLDYLLRSTGIGGKMITPFYDSRNKDLSTAEKIRKAIGSLFVNVTDAK
jgi:hypothetical protein